MSFDAKNYRPISILPNVSKIIEKVMHKQIIQHITSHNILHLVSMALNHITPLYPVLLNFLTLCVKMWIMASMYWQFLLTLSKHLTCFLTIFPSVNFFFKCSSSVIQLIKSYITYKKQRVYLS